MDSITYSQAVAALDTAYTAQKQKGTVTAVAASPIGANATLSVNVAPNPSDGWAVVVRFTLGARILWVSRGSQRTNTPSVAAINAEQKAARAQAYASRGCSDIDYVDAVTKQSSGDPALKATGNAQLAAVLAARLKVKADYPYVS